MKKVLKDVSTLAGLALNYATLRADGFSVKVRGPNFFGDMWLSARKGDVILGSVPDYHECAVDAATLAFKRGLTVGPCVFEKGVPTHWFASWVWPSEPSGLSIGPDPQTAICRAIVTKKFGKVVLVPEILLENN